MAPKKNTCSANVAMGSTMKVSRSNKSGKISTTGFFYQVVGIQIKVLKIVMEETISQTVTKAPAEASATKELKEYVDAAEDNFEIDLNYSLG